MAELHVINIVEGEYESIYFVNEMNQHYYLLDIPDYTAFRRIHPGLTCEMREARIMNGAWAKVLRLTPGIIAVSETDTIYRQLLFDEYWERAGDTQPEKEVKPMLHSYDVSTNAPVKALMLFRKDDKPEVINGYDRDIFLYNSVDGITRLNFLQFLRMTCLKHEYDIRFAKLQEGDLDPIQLADFKFLTGKVSSMDTRWKCAEVHSAFRSLWYKATGEVMSL